MIAAHDAQVMPLTRNCSFSIRLFNTRYCIFLLIRLLNDLLYALYCFVTFQVDHQCAGGVINACWFESRVFQIHSEYCFAGMTRHALDMVGCCFHTVVMFVIHNSVLQGHMLASVRLAPYLLP